MLQGIRASSVQVPFGPSVAFTASHRMDNYSDMDPWTWSSYPTTSSAQTYSNLFDSPVYSSFVQHAPHGSANGQPRHHSIATMGQTLTATPPPPPRQPLTGSLAKAQPAFKPTWHGFLDTTKDAMTVVEAALQGRLSHISRRPHDKERAEMLTSGTVIVYEENASGIKRWTDAVHWSPSRVMNNCLIYRQLTRALKPEEKRSALNPSSGVKRKRKEGVSPSITNTGENSAGAEDEYEDASLDAAVPGDLTPTTEPVGKVYANFAQSLTPDQQRRFCGSLIDSYEFKEGGLMKKTISVKYQGTHHHVISYYSLEDVVNGKLNRPYQDPKLSDIQPRAELLMGWKVSLEDEENKDLPLIASYATHLQPSHIQHHALNQVSQGVTPHGVAQTHAPLQLQIPTGYWQSSATSHYTPTQQSPQHYVSHQHTSAPYSLPQTSSPYTAKPAPPQQYSPEQTTAEVSDQEATTRQFVPPHPPTQPYTTHGLPVQQYSIQHVPAHRIPQEASVADAFTAQSHGARHYDEQQVTAVQHYSPPARAAAYSTSQHAMTGPHLHYRVPPAHLYDHSGHEPQSQPPLQHHTHSPLHVHDVQRRASAPVTTQNYRRIHTHPQYPSHAQPQTYFTDSKYPVTSSFGY